MWPVPFLLLYQCCMDKNKNFINFLYSLFLSTVFWFIAEFIKGHLLFASNRRPMNLFYFFIIKVTIASIFYYLTGVAKKVSLDRNVKSLWTTYRKLLKWTHAVIKLMKRCFKPTYQLTSYKLNIFFFLY